MLISTLSASCENSPPLSGVLGRISALIIEVISGLNRQPTGTRVLPSLDILRKLQIWTFGICDGKAGNMIFWKLLKAKKLYSMH